MAEEIIVVNDLKRSIDSSKWVDIGVGAFLVGKVQKNHTYVLNVWTTSQKTVNGVVADLGTCLTHLNGGTSIVGCVIISNSTDLTEAENLLVSLPPEVQTAAPGPYFVVCIVQPGQSSSQFYYLSQEDFQLKLLTVNSNIDNLDDEQVTFRLQAQIPMLMYVDNSKPGSGDEWEEKVEKSFANAEINMTSGYVYRLRGTSIFLSPEESVLGVKQNKINTVKQLQNAVSEDDNGRKKPSKSEQVVLMVDLYQKVSGNTDRFAQPTCAPAIHIRSGSFRTLPLLLPLDVIVETDKNQTINNLTELFTASVRSQLHAMKQCLQEHRCKENEFYTPEAFHFSIPHRHTCVTVVYPQGLSDGELENRRRNLHERLCLSLDCPLFRRLNAQISPGQAAVGGYLVNPHVGIPPSGVQGGTAHLVQGNYTYHHYMQDKFDDDKWGCAYRSLQTLVSWFRLQGYSDKPVPSHKEIQQALVTVGDKQASFVGSKKWIGSFEVSFCLEHLLGVTSKFLSVSAGSELASKGQELAQHFDTQGTPIMIGGGVLAHTILGVDYSEMSGDIKFLILDPHYTGGEDLYTIQKEGWCGWKGPNFWDATAHYNLCMPQRPIAF